MSTSDTLRSLSERLQAETPRAVFGEPFAAHGRTLIPVSRVGYGFGATRGKVTAVGEESGGSGGAGLGARPAGIIEITDRGTRFIATVDPVRMAAVLLAGFVALFLLVGRHRRE